MTTARVQRWYQLHLATAVVLMLLLGALLFVNLPPLRRLVHVGITGNVDYYGWPACVVSRFPPADNVVGLSESTDRVGRPIYEFSTIKPDGQSVRNWPRQSWSATHLYIDIGATLAILVGAAFVSERMLRRTALQ